MGGVLKAHRSQPERAQQGQCCNSLNNE